MVRRRLPIGIQTFREIREEGYYYVDKTAYARRLADDAGKHYFLSRPRRFGKSLFVDTLKELYEGGEALFRGLAVHDDWDWSQRRPVVRLDFSGGNFRRAGAVEESASAQIDDIGRRAGLESRGGSAPVRFRRLIEALRDRAGCRAVVLVDEYDKPILDVLDDPEQAKANRDDLRGLYGTLKASDAHVELTFITGVSKFSKVSIFSGLNNLIDLTLDPDYSAICGTRRRTWIRCSRRSCPVWTGTTSAPGTTVTVGWVGSGSTTLSACSSCSAAACSRRTGSSRRRRGSWWTR